MKDYFDFSAFYPVKDGALPTEKVPHSDRMVLAMAYVPMQTFGKIYEADVALGMGTLFPELNKPFYGCSKRWDDVK